MSNCLKYLKGGQTEKTGRETEILKWGGGEKLGQGLGALTWGGGGYMLFMLHVSAAFKGEIFKIFGKEGEPYMGELSILWRDLITCRNHA